MTRQQATETLAAMGLDDDAIEQVLGHALSDRGYPALLGGGRYVRADLVTDEYGTRTVYAVGR